MSNASALFRSLLVYGLCLPLAVFLGYMLANPLAFTTVGVVVVVFSVLAFPLLLRWHHVWLIATWNTTALLFFVPGKPQVWMGLAAASLAISVLQYTLNRRMKFLSVPSVARPLLVLTAVILITARLTGGMGAALFGGDVYGGKRYFIILATVMGYFAIINRRIPPKRAGLYVALFFLGTATIAIANLPGYISPAFNFLFVVFPVASLSAFTDQNSVVGPASGVLGRVGGLGPLGIAGFSAMLACYGIRGVLDTRKAWRLIAFCLFSFVGLLGGFRSVLLVFMMTFALLFYLERLHHTRLLVPIVFVSVIAGGLVILFAPRMPFSVQRALSVLPFIQVDPVARMNAEASSEWRLQMWRDLRPQIPQYLLVGKGYSFSATEQQKIGRAGGDLEGTELVGDYHNGPLSVLLTFGVFGSIAFVWLLIAGLRVVYHNYQFGDPAYDHFNAFLFASFVVKVVMFLLVAGSFHSDLATFLGLLAMSISLNGGVAKPAVVPQPNVVFNRFKLHPSVRRPAGA